MCPPQAPVPHSAANTARQEWTSRSARLHGQILSPSRELGPQRSRREPELLSGLFFWLISWATLHPKSCLLYWNGKTQTKQFRVSVLVTIYPLQWGFDEQGMEKSIVKTPALLITISILAPVKDRPVHVGLHPSHLLLVLKLCEDGPPAGDPLTQTLCTCLTQKGWWQHGLWCAYTNGEVLHAGGSSQLGREWDDAQPSSSVHREEVVRLFCWQKWAG